MTISQFFSTAWGTLLGAIGAAAGVAMLIREYYTIRKLKLELQKLAGTANSASEERFHEPLSRMRRSNKALIALFALLSGAYAAQGYIISGEIARLRESSTKPPDYRQKIDADVEYWKSVLCSLTVRPILSRDSLAEELDDRTQIAGLIRAEGEAAVTADVPRHVSLFRHDALIRNSSGRSWRGCEEITRRSVQIFRNTVFTFIEDVVVDLKINGLAAEATTRHRERYVFNISSPLRRNEPKALSTTNKWSFVKDGDVWRIQYFGPGLSPVPEAGAEDASGTSAREG